MQKQQQNTNVKRLKFGKRMYFFDIGEAVNGSKYLKITESRFVKEGEDRKRNSFLLFKDDMEPFSTALGEVKVELD